MIKLKRIISVVMAISMITSASVSAAEGAKEYISSEGFAEKLDIAANTLSEAADKISNIQIELPEQEETDKFAKVSAKKQWTTDDISCMYKQGYTLGDIRKAITVSEELDVRPFEVLEKRGKPKYGMEEKTEEQPLKADALAPDEEEKIADNIPDDAAISRIEEKSWEAVAAEISGDAAADSDMQFIKENGLLEFIDESMLSEEELEYLSEEKTVSKAAAATSTSEDSMLDMFNTKLFPQAMYNQYNAGMQQSSEEVELNPMTRSAEVRATDISLKGRNGLDLNLTRVNSSDNTGEEEPVMQKASAAISSTTNYVYSVTGYAQVRVLYREPLSNGSYTQTFDSAKIVFRPYKETIGVKTDYKIASYKALNNDRELLESNRMPNNMFVGTTKTEVESRANAAVTAAIDGKYNKVYLFDEGSKIDSIRFTVIADEDVTKKQYEGAYNILHLSDGSDRYITSSYRDNLTDKYFDIGLGWEFDFPYIERRYGRSSTQTIDADYLHFGQKGVWLIDGYNLDGYYLNDLTLTSGETVNGERSYYTVTEKDGKKYHFGDFGELYCIQDRFGNSIKFEYTTKSILGHTYPYRLTKITDSVGREITFDYTNPLQTIVTVADPDDSSQNRTIKYNKELVAGKGDVYLLTSVIDAENQETDYIYTSYDLRMTFSEKSFDYDYETITYHPISEIIKPSGMKIQISNSKGTRNLGNDGIGEMVLSGSYHVMEPRHDKPSKLQSIYRKGVEPRSDFRADGYPLFGSTSEIPKELVYAVNRYEITHGDTKNIMDEYTLTGNRNWKCSTSTLYMENESLYKYVWRERTDYTYNGNEQCIKEEYRGFSDPDDQSTAGEKLVTEYTYDNYGYNDIKKIKRFGSEEYSINFEYDNTYHIPTKKTYKKDADTTIIENYNLTADKKSVDNITVTENNATKRKVGYTYDSYGNIITEKRYTGGNSWNDYMQINYSYDDLSDNTNKINGVYLSRTSVSGVKNADGNLISEDGTVEYERVYDWFGNMISETDSNGNVYTYSYDKVNRPLTMTNPAQGSISIEHHVEDKNNYVEVTNENGNVMRYCYTNAGRIQEVRDITADKLLQSSVYNPYTTEGLLGTCATETTNYSESGNTTITLTATDSMGRVFEKKIKDTAGNMLYEELYDYATAVDNVYNTMTKTVKGETADKNYTVTQYTDKFGNMVKETITYMDGETEKTLTTEYTYDYLGNCTGVKTPRASAENWTGNVYKAQYEYDISGQVTKTTDIYGNYSVNEYDGLGRLIRSADAEATAAATPYYTEYTYDILGRTLKVQTPLDTGMSAETKYYYDNNGNVIKTMVKNGASSYSTTQTAYNWRNQPVKVMTDGTDTAYYYDAAGNVLRMYTGELENFAISGLDDVSGAEYEVTKYAYDTQNRVTAVTDALGKTQYNEYDINGSLLKTTDRNNTIINYTYDKLGNMNGKSAKADETAEPTDAYSYVYNRLGLVTSMSGGGVTSNYTYDNIGRLTKEELTNGIVKTYNYDDNGNRTSFTLTKDGTQQMNTTYEYDMLDCLVSVTNGNNVSNYAYDRNNRLLSDTTDNYTTVYTYNRGGMITGLNTVRGFQAIQSYSYAYYPDGNMSQKQSTINGNSVQYQYQYDNAGRLTREQMGDSVTTYTYDSYNNRAGMNANGVQYSYSYDANNRLIKQSKAVGENTEITDYGYDSNGNLIAEFDSVVSPASGEESRLQIGVMGADADGARLYSYDAYNRLKTYTNGVTNASYTYDGNNLRQSKTVDGVTTNHIWDGANMVMEIKGTTVNKYYRGATGLIYSDIDGERRYYHKDEHGNVAAVTNVAGNVINVNTYDAFGNMTQTNDSIADPFGYCGEYYDAELDALYLRNRYYSPSIGRFITEDPIRDGLNWYAYCGNNPVMFADQSGMSFDEVKWTSLKYNPLVAKKAKSLSKNAIDKATEYAETTGLEYGMPNKSDAWRHFLWSAMMTREMGLEKAKFIGNNHEFKSMIDLGLNVTEETSSGAPKIVIGQLNQSDIMDLWNNQVGRELANRTSFKRKSYEELWVYANKHNMIIENAGDVYQFLGLDESYIADAKNWSVNVEWNTETGDITFYRSDGSGRVTLKIGV